MSDVKEPTSQAVALYLAQEQKIEALRGEIAEMSSARSEYVRRLEVVDTNGKRTHERLEQGVSQTAFKAWEAVQQMDGVIAKVDGHLSNTDINVLSHEKRLDRSDRFDSQVMYGMLITFCLSVFGTVMAFLWNYRGHP